MRIMNLFLLVGFIALLKKQIDQLPIGTFNYNTRASFETHEQMILSSLQGKVIIMEWQLNHISWKQKAD